MISQLIPVKKSNRIGILTATILFILQFVFYQMQDVIIENTASNFAFLEGKILAGISLNKAKNILQLFIVLVHALFSIIIVWFLYKDWQGTKVVIYMSVVLIALYMGATIIGKISDVFFISITATNLHMFIASPFKTIFSIPMLKIKDSDS